MAEALNFMDEREYEVDSNRVLALAAASSCSAYDCEFVALAQEHGVADLHHRPSANHVASCADIVCSCEKVITTTSAENSRVCSSRRTMRSVTLPVLYVSWQF